MAADETPTKTVGQYRCHRPLEGVGEVCQRITATRGLTPVVSIAHPATVYPRCREHAGEGPNSPRIASNDARVRNSVIPTEVSRRYVQFITRHNRAQNLAKPPKVVKVRCECW